MRFAAEKSSIRHWGLGISASVGDRFSAGVVAGRATKYCASQPVA